MSTETLPDWFWVIYYLFFLTTLFASIYCINKNFIVKRSIINVILIVTVYPITFFHSFRLEGTELDVLISALSDGSLWAIYVSIGYIYMLTWWVFLLVNKFSNRSRKSSIKEDFR